MATEDPGDLVDAVVLDFQLDVGVVAIGIVHHPGYPPRPRRFPHRGAENWKSVAKAANDVVNNLAVGSSFAEGRAQRNPCIPQGCIRNAPDVDVIEELD